SARLDGRKMYPGIVVTLQASLKWRSAVCSAFEHDQATTHNQLSCAWPLFVKDFSRRDDGLSTRCCGRRPKSAKARNRGRSQHHHSRANLHPIVEIDHILIGYPDATRGN